MEKLSNEIKQYRKSDYDISPLILNRWSPRAMTGAEIDEQELMAIFEAGRWAPSSYNNQPWRFIYAKRNTKHWDTIFNLMVEFNQSWTKNASALVVVVSKKTFDFSGKPAQTHSFDTGAAWMSLALQATKQGLVAHGMQGFDYDKAKKALNVPDDYNVEAMLAIGKQGKKDLLPKEMQDKEEPSDRKKLSEIAWEGKFK